MCFVCLNKQAFVLWTLVGLRPIKSAQSVHSKHVLERHTGSENQKTSGAIGEQFKESIKINKSLSTLGLVISRLAHTTRSSSEHVPYRDSRLTWLLKVLLLSLHSLAVGRHCVWHVHMHRI